MAGPPPVPSWDQPAAAHFLAACQAALVALAGGRVEQQGLDRLARSQWQGATRGRFDQLTARSQGAFDDAEATIRQAQAAVERAAAAAPTAILAAELAAAPFVPGGGR